MISRHILLILVCRLVEAIYMLVFIIRSEKNLTFCGFEPNKNPRLNHPNFWFRSHHVTACLTRNKRTHTYLYIVTVITNVVHELIVCSLKKMVWSDPLKTRSHITTTTTSRRLVVASLSFDLVLLSFTHWPVGCCL